MPRIFYRNCFLCWFIMTFVTAFHRPVVQVTFRRSSWAITGGRGRVDRHLPASGMHLEQSKRVHRILLPEPLQTKVFSTALSSEDEGFLKQAIAHARHGLGHTFPNPAVGCVIVAHFGSDDETNSLVAPQVIGAGFHPRAGYPHAEVFALLEASGYVTDGVAAAKSVVQRQTHEDVQRLTRQYIDRGPESLFSADCLRPEAEGRVATTTTAVTAYVTLEPCCHTGKSTPPCAAALTAAGVSRVVVGFRDPNPRVDGGGVQYLRNTGIDVDLVEEGRPLQRECAELVANFCRRITPPHPTYESVSGAMRSALRTLAGQRKQDKSLCEVTWGGGSVPGDAENMEELVDALALEPEWMEHLDDLLWREELVLLRLNSAVAKRRFSKRLGERIAGHLQAHVAQTVGHTALLYRPGKPPKLDLRQLVADSAGK